MNEARWMACDCLRPTVQVGGTTDQLDEDDPDWHAPGCDTRKRLASMAFVKAMFNIEFPAGERSANRILTGMTEMQADDLYKMVRWFADVAELYRTKEVQYGRTWAELGWLAQVAQIYRRARRLLVMGWHQYDPKEFDANSAEQNAMDLVTHTYFFHRLLEMNNRKGHV